MAELSSYTSRMLAEPIAAIAICRAYPEYMVIGTYNLLKPDEEGAELTQIRTGSVVILTLEASFKPAFPGAQPPLLGESCLNAAVLDIRFSPSDDSLFGVATSDAKVTFFKIVKHADVLARRVEMRLVCLGGVTVAEETDAGEIPLITALNWLADRAANMGAHHNASICITTSEGHVKLVEVDFSVAASSENSPAPTIRATTLWTSTEPLSHKQEAWTVATMVQPSTSTDISINGTISLGIYTGGDDCALITSCTPYQLTTISPQAAPFTPTPSHLHTNHKSHTAGVTSILPLSPSNSPILLTGSYDEHVRLFPIPPRKPFLSHNLGGGVWQLQLIDETPPHPNSGTYRALVLASCMHTGARILRLHYDPAQLAGESGGWSITVVARFTKGHESMVYACGFRKEVDEQSGGLFEGRYTVVSTSFYDKKVCVWRFEDGDFAKSRIVPKGVFEA